MNALVHEWVVKAEGDFTTAMREFRARKQPNFDSTCFHAQQVVEKYLKAYLQDQSVMFPKTHNLIELLELCKGIDPSFDLHRHSMIALDGYATRFRYPGDSADKSDARHAISACHIDSPIRTGKIGDITKFII